MPSNFRFVHSLIWTAALICINYGAPVREENMLNKFVTSFVKQCDVLSYVVLPRYEDDAGTYDLQNYSLHGPLEACSTSDQSVPAIPICEEAFQLIYNLSTCSHDTEMLTNTGPPSIPPIKIAVQTDNVCEGFYANPSIFTRGEKFIAFELTNKNICPLVCKEKVMIKACSFLLWGYQVQASIHDALNKVLPESKIPDATHESKNAEGEVPKQKDLAVASPNVSKEDKSSNAASASSGPSGDENKQKGPKPTIPSKPIDSESKISDKGQYPPAKQKVPVSKVKLNYPKTSPKTVSSTVESSIVVTGSDGANVEDDADFLVKNDHPKSAATLAQAKPNKDSAVAVPSDALDSAEEEKGSKGDVSPEASDVPEHSNSGRENMKDHSNILVSSEHQKSVTALVQAKPSKDSAIAASSDISDTAEKEKGRNDNVSPQSFNAVPEGSDALDHSSSSGKNVKDHSDPLVNSEHQEITATHVQAEPSKDSAAAVPGDGSDIEKKEKGKKTDVSSQSLDDALEGSYVGPYLNENSEVDSAIGNKGDIPQKKNPVDKSVKDEENEVQEHADPSSTSKNKPKMAPSEVVLENMDDAKAVPADDDESFADGRFEGENGESDYEDEQLNQSVVAKVGNDAQNSESLTNPAVNSAGKNSIPAAFPEQEDTHFFFYFITIIIFAVGGYVLFHNKQKIFALIIEGRHERRRRSGASYKKLETK